MSPVDIRTATRVWLLLVAITLMTLLVGESGWSGLVATGMVLAGAYVKGQLVVDQFMGLRRVRLPWRLAMYGWLLLICLLIALAYLLGQD